MKSTDCRSSRLRLIRFSDVSPCHSCPQAGQCPLPPVREHSAEAFQPLARLEPGETLFSSGQPFRNLYAVRRGILARWQVNDEHQPTVVGFYLPGELAGLGGFAYGRYWFSAVAIQPAIVCPLDSERLAATDSPIGMQVLKSAMAWQAKVDARQHRYLMLAEPRRKVVDCLKALRQRSEAVTPGSGEQLRISVPLMANHLRLSVATVRDLVAHDAADQVAL
ncbi:Crp/Fnr family transcriptional regulator [Ectothiorhodospiraceae bacterium WFHF3C12]|nr:Crp/Fnr family transcriptional regulator [Ectothiorhodospiraceae bacterium WFHF3C12]